MKSKGKRFWYPTCYTYSEVIFQTASFYLQ